MKKVIIWFLERLFSWLISPILWNRLWDASTTHYIIRGMIIDLAATIDKTRKPWAVLGLWPHSTLDSNIVESALICYKVNLTIYADKPWKKIQTQQAFEEVMRTPLSELW